MLKLLSLPFFAAIGSATVTAVLVIVLSHQALKDSPAKLRPEILRALAEVVRAMRWRDAQK